MPHLPLPQDVFGIRSAFTAYPDTALPMRQLAQQLLRGPSSLTPFEREVIATAVSAANRCRYCSQTHGAAARALDPAQTALVDAVLREPVPTVASPLLRALLRIAEALRSQVQGVTEDLIAAARAAGANDKSLHDTVLIAAAFCMYNRDVDGLATNVPVDPSVYATMGEGLARQGYVPLTAAPSGS